MERCTLVLRLIWFSAYGNIKAMLSKDSPRYGVHILVWYETCQSMEAAIAREKAIKEWKRAWKIGLIEEVNPDWRDLYDDLL